MPSIPASAPASSIFRAWTYQDAVTAYQATVLAAGGSAAFTANAAFAERGDHWQNGEGWPIAAGLNPLIRQKILQQVEPQFRPLDVIGEVLDNVANGLLDQEPDVSFTPIAPPEDPDSAEAEAEQAEIEAMVRAISAWWDHVQFWEECRKAVRRSRWATYGTLRAWIAPSVLITSPDGRSASLPTNLSLDGALAAIRLMAPTPESGFLYTDPDTQQQCGVFFYATGPTGQQMKKAELWYLDGGNTVLRVVSEGSGAEAGQPGAGQAFPLPVGRRLPLTQMIADLLITETVRRQQKSLNYIETLLVRVIEAAGFPERYTTNAMPSGVWLRTPPTDSPPIEVREVDGVRWYLHPAPRALGPMVTTDLRGVTVTRSEKDGGDTLATPGVVFKEPTDPDYLIRASDHGRTTILRECKQAHLATESTAEASGIAYVQSRAIFGKDLRATKSPLENMVRATIEFVVALAEHLSGVRPAQSFLTKYRCVVNLHVDTGPTVPAELAEYREQNKAGLLSRESAMARAGVEDTAAEIEALASDPIALANLRTVQGQAMAALQLGGAGFFGAAQAIGLSVDEAKTLMASDTDALDVTP